MTYLSRPVLRMAAVILAGLTALASVQPVAAQADNGGDPYTQGYRDGYRDGFADGQSNRAFDDRPGGAATAYPDEDPAARWRQQYDRTYSYQDDVFYRECRQSPDPAGVIVGALIGGLLGSAVGDGRGGATFAGIILGGATGAALTADLSCEDRSYAYRTYYDGLNAGYPNRIYRWRNPRNGRHGAFRVGEYYRDRYGFRCATYSQSIFIQGRVQEARGRACRQPDGSWVIVQ